MDHINAAIAELQAITDPETRVRSAGDLDDLLVHAREIVREVKAAAVRSMRDSAGSVGYGRIGAALGLSRARVKQIIDTPRTPAVYAYRDQDGMWRPDGAEGLLPEGEYYESDLGFEPATPRPEAGQRLRLRIGPVDANQVPLSLHAIHVERPDGNARRVIATQALLDEMFREPSPGQ